MRTSAGSLSLLVSLACLTGGVPLMPTGQALGQSAASISGPLGAVERSRLRELAIDELMQLATSDDAQVRANAVEGLILAPGRLETILPGALADPNVGVRTVAAMAVGRAEIEGVLSAVEPLVKDASPYVRAAAIYALRQNGHEINPTPLGGMVTQDPSLRVRAHAAFLLGELGDKGTASLLREAARTDVKRASTTEMKVLNVQIAEALVKLGDTGQLDTIRAALYPATPDELDATVLAIQVLGQLNDRASIGQLRNLGVVRDGVGGQMPVEVRLAVAGTLGRLGVEVDTTEAAAALAGGSEPQRIQAAWAFGEIAGSGSVRALEERMGEGSERVRVAVASALLKAAERSR
ncbi:MAG: HEAT repeat domain-containing protein [Planctomycetota bacterium]|nr:HEAT repeat domain-containing protein [Planctomycetota bacterium]